MEKKADNPKEGDVVVYLNGQTVIHIGIISKDGKVISKWSGGPLFKHNVTDIPTTYGDNIGYYIPIEKKKTVELYLKWQKKNMAK